MRHGLAALIVGAFVGTFAGPAAADPNPQLANSVATRLLHYGLEVRPEALTTPQAAALHLLLSSGGNRTYLETRRRARAILRNPDFRD